MHSQLHHVVVTSLCAALLSGCLDFDYGTSCELESEDLLDTERANLGCLKLDRPTVIRSDAEYRSLALAQGCDPDRLPPIDFETRTVLGTNASYTGCSAAFDYAAVSDGEGGVVLEYGIASDQECGFFDEQTDTTNRITTIQVSVMRLPEDVEVRFEQHECE